MEPVNFNDFIKSNTKNDLPVPAELNWENMNFNLPPAKRKPRFLLWMLFFLMGASGTGGVLWYVYQKNITQSRSLSKNELNGIKNRDSLVAVKKEPAFADMAHPQDAAENTFSQNNTTNKEITSTERLATADKAQPQDAGKNSVKQNNGINKETVRAERPAGADMPHPEGAGKNSAARNKVAKKETFKTERMAGKEKKASMPLYLSNDGDSIDIEYTKAKTQYQMEPSQPGNTGNISQNLQQMHDSGTLTNALPVEPVRSASPENHVAVSAHAPADSNAKHAGKSARSTALLVNIGKNYTHLNHSSARLNDAVTPAWGNSYQILLEHELKKNWLLSVGLSYHRLHTTFSFEKDLGTFVNPSRFQIIRKTRNVFHNNYFNVVSLNIGAGKQFELTPRLRGQFLMYLSPSYRLSNTGKSIDDTLAIITMGPNTAAQKQWLFNADAALRISYSMKNTDLIFGVNFSQSLSRSGLQTVGNSTITVQPRVFGLNLGIKRALVIRKK